jgi:hypothetical protein
MGDGAGEPRSRWAAAALVVFAVLVGAAVTLFAWFVAHRLNLFLLGNCDADVHAPAPCRQLLGRCVVDLPGCNCGVVALRRLAEWFSPLLFGGIAAGAIARRAHWRAGLGVSLVCVAGAASVTLMMFAGWPPDVRSVRNLVDSGAHWVLIGLLLFGPAGGWLGGRIRGVADGVRFRSWPMVVWAAAAVMATGGFAYSSVLECVDARDTARSRSANLDEDLKRMREKNGDWSTERAINAASRVFQTVHLEGMTEREARRLLGDRRDGGSGPPTDGDFGYEFNTGFWGLSVTIHLDENGKVKSVERTWGTRPIGGGR